VWIYPPSPLSQILLKKKKKIEEEEEEEEERKRKKKLSELPMDNWTHEFSKRMIQSL
jgi:hypothetical protein